MKSLISCAREAGYQRMDGSVLPSNLDMLRLVDQLGFVAEESDDPHRTLRVVLPLTREHGNGS